MYFLVDVCSDYGSWDHPLGPRILYNNRVARRRCDTYTYALECSHFSSRALWVWNFWSSMLVMKLQRRLLGCFYKGKWMKAWYFNLFNVISSSCRTRELRTQPEYWKQSGLQQRQSGSLWEKTIPMSENVNKRCCGDIIWIILFRDEATNAIRSILIMFA